MGIAERLSLLVVVAAIVCLAGASTASAATLTINENAIQAVEDKVCCDVPLATLVDFGGSDPTSGIHATINWGDGSSSVGTVTGTDAQFAITGMHTYAEEGSYTVEVDVTADAPDSASGSSSGSQTVQDAPLLGIFDVPEPFSGAGPSAATALAAFEAMIGGTRNTVPTQQNGGFRQLNWDGVKLDGSEPGSIVISNGKVVALPANAAHPFGLELATPLAVGSDGFASVNPAAAGLFPAFSAPNVAAPFNSNILVFDIVAPASTTGTTFAQATRGLGFVFLNVRQPNTTSVTYFNGNRQLVQAFAPVGGASQPSFVAQLFRGNLVTRVVITLGNAQIFSFDGTTFGAGPADSGNTNLVAADDVVLAEPAPQDPNIGTVAGNQFSGVVSTFTDTDQNANLKDYTATIDWGDGSLTAGRVAGGPHPTWKVAGTHTYAQPGGYEVVVTATDVGGGAKHVSRFNALVIPRSTTTTMRCSPNRVLILLATTCTTIVKDTAAGTPVTPSGTVVFSSDRSGGFGPGGGCTLAATKTAGQSSCQTTYTPFKVGKGKHHVSAAYGGDAMHSTSTGSATVSVAPAPPSTITPRCSIKFPSTKLARHAGRFTVNVTCDAPAVIAVSARALLTPPHSHTTRIAFGQASALVAAGKRASLTIKIPSNVLAQLQAAARAHDRISLALTLTAINRAARTKASGSVRTLHVATG